MPWYAHSFTGRPEAEWETQREHAARVAKAAALRADKFGMAPIAEMAGWLHDLGKYTSAFQGHIAGRGRAAEDRDHSSAGAVYARNRVSRPVGAIVAHIVAGHHAGLKDALLGEGQRLDRREAALGPVVRTAGVDGFPFPGAPPPELAAKLGKRSGFALALLTRMLFSCLVDADRAETRASEIERLFEAGLQSEEDEASFTATPADLAADLERATAERDAKLRLAGEADDPINRLRTHVRDHVAAQASLPPGVFTLTVPTGGGKTLTSLRFALDHARANGLDRVLVIIPFTSVIEQTADVYRQALPAFAGQILEHHSGFSDGRAEREGESEEGTSRCRRLVTETWAAPLVLTTAVQFFESLFGARAAQCRKLHNIARSVIVLDEAQTMPLHLLRPCVAALKELKRRYGCSIVLSTATQPALEDRPEDKGKPPGERRSFAGGFIAPRELAPEPKRLFEDLDRVTIAHAGALDDAALVARMRQAPAALCIVNSRAHARELYEALEKAGVKGARHLSTLMLPEHRRRVLAEIKADLTATPPRPCYVASTSLVEAGVDFSFPLVLRADAGLEQIVQAAGRSNRNGELGPGAKGDVVIFEASGRKPLAAMTANIEVAREIMRHHARPQMPEAIEAYYQHLYHRRGLAELDRPGVIEACRQKERTLAFPFEQIAKDMRFIEDVMKPIIVPIDDTARKAVAELDYVEKPGRQVRTLQRYTVGVPPRASMFLLAEGAAQAAKVVNKEVYGASFIVLTNLDLYRDDVGLTWVDPTFMDAGRLVV